jgi:hypothetical protein
MLLLLPAVCVDRQGQSGVGRSCWGCLTSLLQTQQHLLEMAARAVSVTGIFGYTMGTGSSTTRCCTAPLLAARRRSTSLNSVSQA